MDADENLISNPGFKSALIRAPIRVIRVPFSTEGIRCGG